MNNTPPKLRLIFLPFLTIAICVIPGYTFLNWLIFIKFHIISLNEEFVNLWIPLLLSFIPGLIWMRSRIKLLRLRTRKSDLPFVYLMVACFAIGISTAVAQSWLQTASGKLTALRDINDIEKQPASKYYTLKNVYIDKARTSAKAILSTSGRRDEYLNMTLFFVSPIMSSAADTSRGSCVAWLGIKYHQQISNSLSEDVKKTMYRGFAEGSEANFEKRELASFAYLDRIGNSDDHRGFRSAIGESDRFSGSPDLVLVPIDGSFEARNGNKFAWIFGSFGIGAGIWLIMILIPGLDEDNVDRLQAGKNHKTADGKDFFFLFLPREGYFITPIIVDLNLLIFIAMVFGGLGFLSFDSADLVRWGADYKPAVAGGQWWRLVTNIFVHGGFIHVLANSFGLIFGGLFLEPRMGRGRYAAVYLATGVIASITSLWWHDATVSIGASGAIFGLYGALLALILTKAYPKDFARAFLPGILIFVCYNLLMGLRGSIDNAAHLGGLVSGFAIGLLLSQRLKAQAVA